MKRLRILGFIGAFVLQTALLAWIVGDRALLLANGTEISLAVAPVDPRDLLRGDYVVLTYAIDRLDESKLAGDDGFFVGDEVYVTMEKDGDSWRPAALARRAPAEGIALRGKVNALSRGPADCTGACMTYTVDYGIGRFFVPEGEGKALETLRNDQRLSVDVAVASNGRAAIKRLRVDGEVRYAEPLI